MPVGSIDDTVDRIRLWCRLTPQGLAFAEFQSELARQRVIAALRTSLPEEAGPFHELSLAPAPVAVAVVHRLVDDLKALGGGVVSLDGFGPLFPPGRPPADLVSAFNFNRERLAALPLKQIWWIPPRVLEAFRHGARDLYSWFRGRWQLTEEVSPDTAERPQAILAVVGDRLRPAHVDDARRRAADLAERFERALGERETPLELIEEQLLRPAVRALLEVGAEREARELEASLRQKAMRLRPSPDSSSDDRRGGARVSVTAGRDIKAGRDLFVAGSIGSIRTGSSEEMLPEEDTLERAKELNSAGESLYRGARYAEAEGLFERSLRIREKMQGRDHPDVAALLNNLANLYREQSRYAEAEPLYRRALRIWENLLGDEHPSVATALNNLAALYTDLGRHAEAELLFERALRIWEESLGPEHPSTQMARQNLEGLQRPRPRKSIIDPSRPV